MNHMPNGTHHHCNAVQRQSNISHLNTNDHHSMMKMYFHGGFIETILFKSWTTTSILVFIESWIFIFILGIVYEGIRALYQCFDEERLMQTSTISRDENENENELEPMNTESSKSTSPQKKKISLPYTKRILYGLIYIIYLSLNYIFMLIVMTFNVYLFLAIIFGIGTGYWLYTWSGIIPSINKNLRWV